MFSSLLKSQDALLAAVGFVETPPVQASLLDDCFWSQIKVAESLFQAIVKCLTEFEKDEPVLSSAYPKFHQLQDHFIHTDSNDKVQVLALMDHCWTFIVNETMLLGM